MMHDGGHDDVHRASDLLSAGRWRRPADEGEVDCQEGDSPPFIKRVFQELGGRSFHP
jgi:hypothetical protein